MKKSSIIITIIALIVIVALLGVLGYGYYQKATVNIPNPVATMEIKDYGTVKIELYPDMAPNTVANFITLANNGHYDGLTFHRVVKDFMIQGGDVEGDGTGGVNLSAIDSSIEKDSSEDAEYNIKGEFVANGFEQNTLKHTEGVISMARSDYTQYSGDLADESYNSAGGQFFIMTADVSSLDGQYAAFGKVIEGMDVVHNIEDVELEPAEEGEQETSTPVDPPVITSIRVETYGADYGKPETLEAFNLYDYLGIKMPEE